MRSVEQIRAELTELDIEIADHDSGAHPLDAAAFGQVWNRRQEITGELRKLDKEKRYARKRGISA